MVFSTGDLGVINYFSILFFFFFSFMFLYYVFVLVGTAHIERQKGSGFQARF